MPIDQRRNYLGKRTLPPLQKTGLEPSEGRASPGSPSSGWDPVETILAGSRGAGGGCLRLLYV